MECGKLGVLGVRRRELGGAFGALYWIKFSISACRGSSVFPAGSC